MIYNRYAGRKPHSLPLLRAVQHICLFLSFVLETNMKSYRIATIPGDGIGKEVVPEGIRVLETAGRKHGFTLQWTQLPWSCEFYQKTGQMMPADGLDQLK